MFFILLKWVNFNLLTFHLGKLFSNRFIGQPTEFATIDIPLITPIKNSHSDRVFIINDKGLKFPTLIKLYPNFSKKFKK